MKELNLIPISERIKREKKIKIRNYFSGGVIILCLLFIIVYIPQLRVLKLRQKEDSLKVQVNLNSKAIEDNIKINTQIKSINDYTNKITLLTKQKVRVTDKITDIQKLLPRDIVLVNLNYTKEVVTLSGEASNYNSIAEFAANLQTAKSMKSAKLINISNLGNSKYSFTININY